MHDQLLLLVGVLEHDFGAVHVGLDRVDRALDDQFDADRGGEVEDDVGAIDPARRAAARCRPCRSCRGSRARLEMRDVVDRAGRQVVEHLDLVAALRAALGEVRADEARAAGDQGFHAVECPFTNAPISRVTRVTSASTRRGCIGSDSSSAAAAEATGHSIDLNAAKAPWADNATG